jgi:hypothetical protein
VHARGHLGRARLPHRVGDQVADRVRAQPGQREHRGPRRQRGQDRAGGRVHVAVAAQDRHRPGGQAAGQEVEQQLRRLVHEMTASGHGLVDDVPEFR